MNAATTPKPHPPYTSSICKACGRRYRIRWRDPDDGYCRKHTTSRRGA